MENATHRRAIWARNLTKAMDTRNVTVKTLHRALLEAGIDVSPQAIYAWRNGTSSPTIEKQAVVAEVLRSEVPDLFPAVAA